MWSNQENKYTIAHNEKGVSAVLVAIMITMLFGFVSLAIDVGHGWLTRNQLQDAADAAALAATRWLGCKYKGNLDPSCPSTWTPMTYTARQSYDASGDAETIISVAKNIASQNTVANQRAGGSEFSINSSDVMIGTWDTSRTPDHFFATYTGTCENSVMTECLTSADCSGGTCNKPNAVRTIARRDSSSANGPITTFFASTLGISSMNVSARATAALTPQSTAGPGGLPLPAAVNKSWMDSVPCNQNLTFHPSSAGLCSAWHAYDGSTYKPNGSGKKGIGGEIQDLTAGTYSSPETIAGETQYDFTNGTLADVFTQTYIQDLFNAMKVKNDNFLDNDTDPTTWTTTVAVFDDTGMSSCNPSGPITIVGFATITITSVSGPPLSTVYATLKCDNVEPGRGGGGGTGTLGSIPGLVQ